MAGFRALVAAALLSLGSASVFRGKAAQGQEPDTSCGKGYDSLVPGSKKYYDTAVEKLWTHPGRTGQAGTFETELQCWYANMLTSKCGGLPSQHDARAKDLTAMCTGLEADWLKVWNLFSKEEVLWYKKSFPAESLNGDEGGAPHYKQAMQTMLDLNKKEHLCMTLFVIDDECGAHEYIRTA
eukprot:TRINITY_DN6993_c0_g2_i2.p1 TRINITY_DN6993_c0_g2~~TRINITY_DN6993_c0_g2_i2.p1  ORF type:complete len:182 (+),score=48.53 TRINITY_DN6993_c0_g2_i2:51-596(+)